MGTSPLQTSTHSLRPQSLQERCCLSGAVVMISWVQFHWCWQLGSPRDCFPSMPQEVGSFILDPRLVAFDHELAGFAIDGRLQLLVLLGGDDAGVVAADLAVEAHRSRSRGTRPGLAKSFSGSAEGMPGCAAFLAQDRRVDQEAEEPKEN